MFCNHSYREKNIYLQFSHSFVELETTVAYYDNKNTSFVADKNKCNPKGWHEKIDRRIWRRIFLNEELKRKEQKENPII